MKYHIVHLEKVPEVIPELIEYYIKEWEPYYGAKGIGNAELDIKACCQSDKLPFALVAIDSNRVALGTGALREQSLGSESGEEPWISALLVPQSHRKKGIGEALINALELEAKRMGFTEIYSATDSANTLLLNRGWQALRQVESLRGEATVYRLDL